MRKQLVTRKKYPPCKTSDCEPNYKFDMDGFMPQDIFQNPHYFAGPPSPQTKEHSVSNVSLVCDRCGKISPYCEKNKFHLCQRCEWIEENPFSCPECGSDKSSQRDLCNECEYRKEGYYK